MPDDQKMFFLTKLKEYNKNVLVFSSGALFSYVKKLEAYFRASKIFFNNHLKINKAASLFFQENYFPGVKNCHSILLKIITLFLRTCFFIALKKIHSNIDSNNNQSLSSRSIAVKAAIKKLK